MVNFLPADSRATASADKVPLAFREMKRGRCFGIFSEIEVGGETPGFFFHNVHNEQEKTEKIIPRSRQA